MCAWDVCPCMIVCVVARNPCSRERGEREGEREGERARARERERESKRASERARGKRERDGTGVSPGVIRSKIDCLYPVSGHQPLNSDRKDLLVTY